MSAVPTPEKLKQDDHKSEANLDYIARLFLNIQTITKRKEEIREKKGKKEERKNKRRKERKKLKTTFTIKIIPFQIQ